MYKLKKNLKDYSVEKIHDISNKTVILRSCLNVSVDETGRVNDDTRITESLHTIKYLAENAERVIVVGHLGRPKEYSKEMSMWNVAEVLQEKLGNEHKVQFVEYGSDVEFNSKVILSDNIRFFENEEDKDLDKRMAFAKELAALGDVFVNDSFADYRESASTYDIAKVLPSYLGFKFIEEVTQLSKLSNPQRPYIAVLGGAKLSEKLDTLNTLLESADHVLVGGAMAYTLMKAKGIEVGNSLIEEDKLEIAKEIVNKYSEIGEDHWPKLILPTDHLIADSFNEDSPYEYTKSPIVPEGKVAIDIGWDTINVFTDILSNAQTILWNGPLGVFEWNQSAIGTKEIGESISKSSVYKLVGGGDTIAAINKFGLEGFDHICTGGGAMLAFLSNDTFATLDVIIN